MLHSLTANRFGAKLRALRVARDLTLQALSYELRTSTSYLSQVEHGKIETRISFALKVARFFNVSLDDLIDDSRELPAP